MAFADALFCLASQAAYPFREKPGAYALMLNFPEVCRLTGLDRGTVRDEMDEAQAKGWFQWSSVGDSQNVEVYLLNYTAIADGRGEPHKPRSYVGQGWLNTVYRLSRSYLPQRLLNVIWLMRFSEAPRTISLDELRARAKPPTKARSLRRSEIDDALDQLGQLGIVVPQGGGFWLDRECFEQPAPDPQIVQQRWSPQQIISSPAFARLWAEDQQRAQQALDVLLAGRFEPETELERIYRDLEWIGTSGDLLLSLARRRPKHPGRPAWPDFWRDFLRHRERRRAARQRPRSPLFTATFDESQEAAGLLGLLGATIGSTGELWLGLRFLGEYGARQNARAATDPPRVRMHLRAHSEELLMVTLEPGEQTVRRVPLGMVAAQQPLHFTLHAYANRPLPGFRVEAWLEASPKEEAS
jgi:hypothetical protein